MKWREILLPNNMVYMANVEYSLMNRTVKNKVMLAVEPICLCH